MANDIHGIIEYPGINTFVSGTYTITHGVTPGIIVVNIAGDSKKILQDIEPQGDLNITDGTRTITLKGCRFVEASRVNVQDGKGYRCTFADRRWKWGLGHISGIYNERDAQGQIRKPTRKMIRELAELCLKAMGEAGYDMRDLPDPDIDEVLPSINWEYVNPARALADICDLFKCRVVYQPMRDRVLIAALGEGARLPNRGFSFDRADAWSAPARPSALRFVAGPSTYVAAMRLEAVGEDLDGSIVPINDLSYKPAEGWGRNQIPLFPSCVLPAKYQAKGMTQEDAVAAARKSVYKWYRVTIDPPTPDGFKVTGYTGEIEDAFQIVPLEKIYGAERDENRLLYADPPRVYGSHSIGSGEVRGNSANDARVVAKFSIDSARQLVVFQTPVFKTNRTEVPVKGFFGIEIKKREHGPADLVLVTSVHIRDAKTHQLDRWTTEKVIDGVPGNPDPGTEMTIKREDINYSVYVDMKAGEWEPKNSKTNGQECLDAADAVFNAFDDFDPREAETRTYAMVLDLDPDGSIPEITWTLAGACSTVASYNTEHDFYGTPYFVRRGRERADALQEKARDVVGSILKTTAAVIGAK